MTDTAARTALPLGSVQARLSNESGADHSSSATEPLWGAP